MMTEVPFLLLHTYNHHPHPIADMTPSLIKAHGANKFVVVEGVQVSRF